MPYIAFLGSTTPAGDLWTFTQQSAQFYSNITPEALRFFTETFAADIGQFTHLTEGTLGTFALSGGQVVITNSSGAARNNIVQEGPDLTMPQAGVQIDVVSRTGTLGAYSNCGVGICKDSDNFVFVGFDDVSNEVRIQVKIGGANTFNAGVTRNLSPPYKLGFGMVGNAICAYADTGSGWQYVTGYDVPTGTINFKTASLTGWKAAFTVATPNNQVWTFDNFFAGRFGALASRDYTLVTQENGSPYVERDGAAPVVYLCTTCVDGRGNGYQAVLRLNLITYAVTQTAAIMIDRGGAKQNDLSGHIVYYGPTSSILTIATWGNGLGGAIDAHLATVSVDLLNGSHLVSTTKLTIPLQLAGYACYDTMLLKSGGVWKMVHSISENTSFAGSPFYPAVSRSADLVTWNTVGSQPADRPYEGTKWARVQGVNYATAGSISGPKVYTEAMDYYRGINAVFNNGGGVTQPHAMVFEVDGEGYLVTFDGTKGPGATAAFTWGQLIVHTRD